MCHLAPIRTTVIKCPQTINTGSTGREASCIVAGNVATMENHMQVPEKLKTELPYDLALPLLGLYLERTVIGKETYYPSVHHSTIYSRQNRKATYMSILRGIDREAVVPICSRILFGH